MPHVSGHTSGLMSNPYKQAAESMKAAGIKSLSGETTSDTRGYQARKKQIKSGFKPTGDRDRNGPVGTTGDGRWNAGYDDDTNEKKHWDSIQNDKNRNRILNKTVENYNKSWLGAHAEWGNFEDDTKLTTAIKTGSNFLMRALYAPVDITYAKFVGDPAANIYEGLQEAGYVSPTDTKKTISDTGMFSKLPIGGLEYEQPSPVEFGTGVKTAAEIGTGIYSIPSAVRLIGSGFNKLKSLYPNWKGTTAFSKNKNAKIKPLIVSGNVREIDLPNIKGKTPFLIETKDGQSVWKYYDNVDSPLEQGDKIPLFIGTDEASYVAKSHLDKAHQKNRSYVDGLPKILKWNDLPYADGAQTILTQLLHKSYTAKNSKLKKVLDDAGVTPDKNPASFQTVIINGKEETIPKIIYHATSSFFDKGLKSNAKAIHSADDKLFLGFTDNIDDALGYAKMEQVAIDPNIPQSFQVEPRIYVSVPKLNNTFDVSNNPYHLNEAATYIGTQRYNHIQGIKKIDWDELDIIENYWYGATKGTTHGQWTVQQHINNVKNELSNIVKSNWENLENEMRLFDDITGQPTSVILKDGSVANHKLQLDGYDSFITKELLQSKFDAQDMGHLMGGKSKNQTNIMIFNADKNVIPATQYIDEIPKVKQSPFSGMVYGTVDQPFESIGQYIAPLNLGGKDALGFKKVEDSKLLYELLGDAGDVINKPDTPFDTDTQPSAYASFA